MTIHESIMKDISINKLHFATINYIEIFGYENILYYQVSYP